MTGFEPYASICDVEGVTDAQLVSAHRYRAEYEYRLRNPHSTRTKLGRLVDVVSLRVISKLEDAGDGWIEIWVDHVGVDNDRSQTTCVYRVASPHIPPNVVPLTAGTADELVSVYLNSLQDIRDFWKRDENSNPVLEAESPIPLGGHRQHSTMFERSVIEVTLEHPGWYCVGKDDWSRLSIIGDLPRDGGGLLKRTRKVHLVTEGDDTTERWPYRAVVEGYGFGDTVCWVTGEGQIGPLGSDHNHPVGALSNLVVAICRGARVMADTGTGG